MIQKVRVLLCKLRWNFWGHLKYSTQFMYCHPWIFRNASPIEFLISFQNFCPSYMLIKRETWKFYYDKTEPHWCTYVSLFNGNQVKYSSHHIKENHKWNIILEYSTVTKLIEIKEIFQVLENLRWRNNMIPSSSMSINCESCLGIFHKYHLGIHQCLNLIFKSLKLFCGMPFHPWMISIYFGVIEQFCKCIHHYYWNRLNKASYSYSLV